MAEFFPEWSRWWIAFCVHTFSKFVSHYDLSGLSMPVMGFAKKVWIVGCALFIFFLNFLTL